MSAKARLEKLENHYSVDVDEVDRITVLFTDEVVNGVPIGSERLVKLLQDDGTWANHREYLIDDQWERRR